MKYFFILGRNPQLSVAEVFSYLKRTENKIRDSKIKGNSLLVELENSLDGDAIDFLGGVISIGIVLASGNFREIVNNLKKQELYFGYKNNINYVIWDFVEDELNEIRAYLKKRFKSEKLRASEKKLREKMGLQSGEKADWLGSKNVDEEYFVFGDASGENYFGRIVQKTNYSKIEKRDMEKPVRREELAISPRMAKIMINLSEVKENEKLLDVFCGIGVILEEALLQELKIIGIDKDEKAIKGSEENLNWFGFNKESYELINGDSSRVRIGKVDVLVSEPDLGETLKKIPTTEKAKTQLRNFENLMVKVLNNLKENVKGRIVFTSPLIRIMKKRIGCNIDFILDKTGLKLVRGFPIDEYRGNQIVGRRVFVLER
jgi:tRNA G10  N-methylase Trm11